MLLIGASDIRKHLNMAKCIGAMEELYLKEPPSLSPQPMRTLNRIDRDSLILTMPSYSDSLGRFAVKIVSEFRNNPKDHGLPVQGGVIVLVDGRDSAILAILDSSMLTAIRTGAVGGLAAKVLSRRDSRSAAIIGSGHQARTQLEALCEVRNVSDARVFSRDYSHAKKFADEMSESLEIPVVPHRARADAVRGADIIVLATNSAMPVIKWAEITAGAHINSIGTLPERRELDRETVANASLFVDLKEGVLKEAGDVMEAIRSDTISSNSILGDLGDLISGRCKGRKDDTEMTLFKSVGFGLQDVYASNLVYEKLSRDKSIPEARRFADLRLS